MLCQHCADWPQAAVGAASKEACDCDCHERYGCVAEIGVPCPCSDPPTSKRCDCHDDDTCPKCGAPGEYFWHAMEAEDWASQGWDPRDYNELETRRFDLNELSPEEIAEQLVRWEFCTHFGEQPEEGEDRASAVQAVAEVIRTCRAGWLIYHLNFCACCESRPVSVRVEWLRWGSKILVWKSTRLQDWWLSPPPVGSGSWRCGGGPHPDVSVLAFLPEALERADAYWRQRFPELEERVPDRHLVFRAWGRPGARPGFIALPHPDAWWLSDEEASAAEEAFEDPDGEVVEGDPLPPWGLGYQELVDGGFGGVWARRAFRGQIPDEEIERRVAAWKLRRLAERWSREGRR